MTPRTLYRRIALAEVVTWALLLLGMVLKYVTRTTELGVKVFGLAHGVVFIAFCLVTVLLWVNQRWTAREGLLGLLSAVPPFLTVWWERRLERRGRLEGGWRLGRDGETPTNPAERVVAAAARPSDGRPRRGRRRGPHPDRRRPPRGPPVGRAGLTCSSAGQRVRSQAAYGGFRQREGRRRDGADGCGRSADR